MPTSKRDHTTTAVVRIPNCDLPHDVAVEAYADARLQSGYWAGRWAAVCESHFKQHRCELGIGRGQRYVLEVRA